MLPAASFARTLAQTAETLIIALAGGTAFTLLGFPAGLISGSVLAVAAAALLGRPVRVPVPLARIGYVLIGILLGAVVTPQTVKGFTAWPVSIALVMVAAVCMMLATATYLRMVHGWDRLSALLGASPGSMDAGHRASTELGADLPAIAIVQTMRVAAGHRNPVGLALFGLVAPALPVDAATARRLRHWREIALLHRGVLCRPRDPSSGACAFPAGLLFGAMVGSGSDARLRARASGSAPVDRQRFGLVLGALVGSRFANQTFRLLAGYLGAAFGSFAVSVFESPRSLVLMVAYFFPFPIANIVVAFSPGAQDTMMVLALALHLDPGLRSGASRGALCRHRVLDRACCARHRAGGEALTSSSGRPRAEPGNSVTKGYSEPLSVPFRALGNGNWARTYRGAPE